MRRAFDFTGFGIDKITFAAMMVDEFKATYDDKWTIDEMLLHPREALVFCDQVKRKFGWYDIPDDVILRVILAKRKNPPKAKDVEGDIPTI